MLLIAESQYCCCKAAKGYIFIQNIVLQEKNETVKGFGNSIVFVVNYVLASQEIKKPLQLKSICTY